MTKLYASLVLFVAELVTTITSLYDFTILLFTFSNDNKETPEFDCFKNRKNRPIYEHMCKLL